MKKFGVIVLISALLFGACNSKEVKIRGEIGGLTGTVKLLAELPEEQGMVILTQQEVTDGKINLSTERLTIPARVWVDIAGKTTLEFIADTKDMIWIEGDAKFVDQIKVKGSGLQQEYDKIMDLFKEKYVLPLEPIDKSIQKIMAKEKQSKDDEVMLGVYQLQKQRYVKYRSRYVKTLIEANPAKELSLFLLQDELRDSTNMQRALFSGMKINNKESNIYKVLETKLK